jgi:hypothetical protein
METHVLLWFLFCRRRCGVFEPFFDRWQTRRKRLQNTLASYRAPSAPK